MQNPPRHYTLVGLEVRDPELYARYRSAMMPILATYGGAFHHDFIVAEALLPTEGAINRVFTISFPDRATKAAFFADAAYVQARTRYFEPAVASVSILAEYET